MYLLGFDIGGTKCAAVTANWDGETIELLEKKQIKTDHTQSPDAVIDRLMDLADGLLLHTPDTIGISCGGPLDSQKGIILGPPNLPGWDHVEIVQRIRSHYGAPTHLQNDANACAVAEWKFGAGRGTNNMIFLTFGTGLGAGLILNGTLYEGTNGNAGEVGHIRLAETGPVGYGKIGSFEGFCSGGGIAQLALQIANEQPTRPLYYPIGANSEDVTAKSVADAAMAGDPIALEVFRISGSYLGKGLSLLIDILNPERIVIGSIFARSRSLLWESARAEIEREALPFSASCCQVLPAELGDQIGDYAAIATALL
ncbi:MAG: ROK family protein [Clostridia bacterium]|nr:ROK family protein [Clostridia bacterium]